MRSLYQTRLAGQFLEAHRFVGAHISVADADGLGIVPRAEVRRFFLRADRDEANGDAALREFPIELAQLREGFVAVADFVDVQGQAWVSLASLGEPYVWHTHHL